jgi:hypothetical protein
VDGVAAQPGGDVATDAVVAAARERHAGHVVLGSTDDHVGPERRDLRLPVGLHHGVVLEEALVADHRVVVVPLDADLPQRRVAGEERRVAAACDERLDRVAHALRPVLVVPDRQVQAGPVEHLGVLLEVGVVHTPIS